MTSTRRNRVPSGPGRARGRAEVPKRVRDYTSREPAAKARGRPRDPEVDRAILETTMQLLQEQGFEGLSIEGVAEASGVAKTTIYRRYSSKVELVMSAMAEHMRLDEPPDTGSLKGDMVALHRSGQALHLLAGPGSALIGTLLSERERHPELLEKFREVVIEPRKRQFHAMFERAVARDELPPDADHAFMMHALFGTLWARTISGEGTTMEDLDEIVELVLRAVGARV